MPVKALDLSAQSFRNESLHLYCILLKEKEKLTGHATLRVDGSLFHFLCCKFISHYIENINYSF